MIFLESHSGQIAFIVTAMLGGIAHYLKKVAKGETKATFAGWFGNDNWASTIYTFLVFIFIIIGALAGNIINSQTDIWAALYTGFVTGFATDSGFNSDSKSLTSQINEVKDESHNLFDESKKEKE